MIDLLSPRDPEFPDDLAYAYLLGTALLHQGDTEKGQVLIDRIFKQGESAEGHLLMGMAHLNRRDYQNAVPELAKAGRARSLASDAAGDLRPRLARDGRPREGDARISYGARTTADNFDANLQLGTLYRLDQGYQDLALTYLHRAQAVRPDDVALRHAMAATLLSLGEADKARELLEGLW